MLGPTAHTLLLPALYQICASDLSTCRTRCKVIDVSNLLYKRRAWPPFGVRRSCQIWTIPVQLLGGGFLDGHISLAFTCHARPCRLLFVYLLQTVTTCSPPRTLSWQALPPRNHNLSTQQYSNAPNFSINCGRRPLTLPTLLSRIPPPLQNPCLSNLSTCCFQNR